MKTVVEHIFNGPTGLIDSYDSSKTMLGSLMKQYSGVCGASNYVSTKSPNYINIGHTYAYSTQSGLTYQFGTLKGYQWSPDKYWLFLFPRQGPSNFNYKFQVSLIEFDSNSSNFSLIGKVEPNMAQINSDPPVFDYCDVAVINYNKGTVSAINNGVTGSNTQFITDQITYANRTTGTGGARIGFGATYAWGITQWYEISGVCTENYLQLKNSISGNIAPNSPYVIEEIRLLFNQGAGVAGITSPFIFYSKGVNYNNFVNNDNFPPAQPNMRNNEAGGRYVRLNYEPNAFLIANGLTGNLEFFYLKDTFEDYQTYYGYSIGYRNRNTGFPSGIRINRYNIFGGLSGSSSNLISAFTNSNGSTGGFKDIFTQRLLELNTTVGIFPNDAYSNFGYVQFSPAMRKSMIHASPRHGVGKNKNNIFICLNPAAGSQGRIFRFDVDNLFNQIYNLDHDYTQEVPPGGVNISYIGTRAFWCIEYDKFIDSFLASTNANATRCYTFKYETSGIESEKIFGTDLNLVKGFTAWNDEYKSLYITNSAAPPQFVCKGGWMFTMATGVINSPLDNRIIQAVPIGADGYYAKETNQRIITPKLILNNALKIYRLYINAKIRCGVGTITFPAEAYKVFYRTTGIDNNSGSWTEVPISGDLTGIDVSNEIQFMFELDVLGETGIPVQIYSVGVVYETDNTQDSHYEPSSEKSSATNRQFAWKQVSSWGSNIPDLKIRIYNSSTNSIILSDTVSSSSSGTFQYSTDGSTWNSWNSTQDTVGNYIRYTATELPGGINIRVLLTQA